MRLPLLFPLAFLSGIHGFFFFMPYLLLVLTAACVIRFAARATLPARPLPSAVPPVPLFQPAELAAA